MIWKSQKNNRKELGYVTRKVAENTHKIADIDRSDKFNIAHIQTNITPETSI